VTSGPDGPLHEVSAAELLPERRAAEAAQVDPPLRLLASAPIGATHRYLLVEDARGVTYGVPTSLTDPARRSPAGDGAAEALVAALTSRAPADGLEFTVFHVAEATGERSIPVDQTNELVVVGDAAVVKWQLHPTADEQPAPRRLATLAAAGFEGTPRTWALVHLVVDDRRYLVATVSDYVPGAVDGWQWAVDEVRSIARGSDAGNANWPGELGRLVADLHASLASTGVDEASEADACAWRDQALADAAAAQLPPPVVSAVTAELSLLGRAAGTPIIDVHGDLHIGQILRTTDPDRYLVIDFDGNPTQPPAARMARQPAARDVAGMLASLDHVGRVVLHRTPDLDEPGRVLDWIETAQQQFLAAYRQGLADAGMPHLLDERLVAPMQVQQECREYAYADRYLPHWRYVPDAALPALLARIAESESP
jgi:maltokinase